MRCPSCGGVSHPATGSVLPSGEVVCGPCVRRFWAWASEHGKKTYRVGKKGKGSKYIAFPTGITKKNAAERDAITLRTVNVPPNSFAVDALIGGEAVGELITVKIPRQRLFLVRHIEVGETLRRRGIGTALYEAAAAEAERRGGQLASAERDSAMSEGFWQKQVSKGRTTLLEGRGRSWGRLGPAMDALVLKPGVRDLKNNPKERDCIKCSGTGYIPRFGHYAQGVCFDCGGTGVARKGWRGPALPPSEPESVEVKIKRYTNDLRTMWSNYTASARRGDLDEMFFLWAEDEVEWAWQVRQERLRPSVAMGKKAWLETAQSLIDDLRKLGAGAKADEIARQFQSRLRVPVKNSRRRTSRNPYYHATRSDLAEKILREHKLKAHPSAKYGGRLAVFAGDTRSPRMADAAMKWADTRHMYHYTGSPDEETVLIEFDARDPDDRRGLTGGSDPSGDEAVWFGDLDLVRPRIVKRRRPELVWNRRRTSKRRTSRRR